MNAFVDWREFEGGIAPFLVRPGQPDRKIDWAAQPGSQQAFLECPVFECLMTGTRGSGKTDVLLMDFAQHVGKGYGRAWRGILFRRTYPELEDVIAKSEALFSIAFPGAVYNRAKSYWQFKDGERLYFRQFAKPSDYWTYHGHAYTWIAWEELTNWPTPECYLSMFSCARSPVPGIPIKVRATTNSYGRGHNWVKHRWRLGGMRAVGPGPLILDSVDIDGNPDPPRVAINSSVYENKVLLAADPSYIDRIRSSASNPEMVKAWLEGSWDIVAGGMFDDLWNPAVHVVEPFDIPDNWRIDRSFDWGGAHPFSVGWWAESNGEDVKLKNGKKLKTIRGDLFRVAEWYGWNGKPNEGINLPSEQIAEGIKEIEAKRWPSRKILPGPADSAIFGDTTGKGQENTIASEMRKAGVAWLRANKGKESRKNGAQAIRTALFNADPRDRDKKPVPREKPGLFIFSICEQFKRTVPVLPRSDKDLDDVDSDAEDHVYDEVRYRIFKKKQTASRKHIRGR